MTPGTETPGDGDPGDGDPGDGDPGDGDPGDGDLGDGDLGTDLGMLRPRGDARWCGVFGGGDPSVFLLRFVFLPASSPKNRPAVVPVLVVPAPSPSSPNPSPALAMTTTASANHHGATFRVRWGARSRRRSRRRASGAKRRRRPRAGNRSRPSREATKLLLGASPGTTTARGEARHVRVGGRFEARVRGEGVVVRRGVVVVVVVVVVAPVDRGDDRASVDGDLKRAAPIARRARFAAPRGGRVRRAQRGAALARLAEALCGAISDTRGRMEGRGGGQEGVGSASASARVARLRETRSGPRGHDDCTERVRGASRASEEVERRGRRARRAAHDAAAAGGARVDAIAPRRDARASARVEVEERGVRADARERSRTDPPRTHEGRPPPWTVGGARRDLNAAPTTEARPDATSRRRMPPRRFETLREHVARDGCAPDGGAAARGVAASVFPRPSFTHAGVSHLAVRQLSHGARRPRTGRIASPTLSAPGRRGARRRRRRAVRFSSPFIAHTRCKQADCQSSVAPILELRRRRLTYASAPDEEAVRAPPSSDATNLSAANRPRTWRPDEPDDPAASPRPLDTATRRSSPPARIMAFASPLGARENEDLDAAAASRRYARRAPRCRPPKATR